MAAVVETPANLLAVHALAAMGKGDTEIASTLQIDRSTAWRLRHKDLLDPALIEHASKTLANKMLLSATAALDTYLDKAEAGELAKEQPGRLIKMAATAMESAVSYAALSGQKDMLNQISADFGIGTSHSVSRITHEQRTTVEIASKTPQPVVVSGSHE